MEGERRGEKEGVGEKKEGRERWREKGRGNINHSIFVANALVQELQTQRATSHPSRAPERSSNKHEMEWSAKEYYIFRFYVNKKKSS